ncbi:MAG TPA: response regulator, partial [Planctomycetota bacterium]|nr:response regulator [Planctomycetota bacterium]
MPANNALIVADADSDRRHELADALEGMGFDVRVVSDASAALDACESAVPSAVVCDVRLPGGGVDLIQALRSRIATAGVRVVLTLDPADQTPANRARFAAADAALVRPFQPRTLAACLRTLEAEAELFSGGDDDGQADVAGFFEIADAKARRENPLLPQLVDAMTGLW